MKEKKKGEKVCEVEHPFKPVRIEARFYSSLDEYLERERKNEKLVEEENDEDPPPCSGGAR